MGRASSFLRGLRSLLPLPAWWIIQKRLEPGGRSLLDIGCGRGGPIGLLNRKRKLFSVGADVFWPYLQHCKATRLYDDLVCCDVRYLPFLPESFDVVLCGEVVEHLERVEALALMKSIEAIARRQVIISTPVGQCEQYPYDGNPYQAHHSSWMPQDFRRLGYTVRGSGLRGMGGLISRETSPLPEWLRLLANAIWMLATPFSYYFPRIAGNMVCVMNIRGEDLRNARGAPVSSSPVK